MRQQREFYRYLGNTGYLVSSLCYGMLTIGPRQKNLSLSEGAGLLRFALESGVNFFDTAEYYETYPYMRAALTGWDQEVVVATKSYAATACEMRKSLEAARKGLQMDTIPIFLLHEQESAASLRGHWEAFEYLLEAKEKGMVGAVGLSTHTVAGVRAGAARPEVDVIHPLYNLKGRGIKDGAVGEMKEAISLALQMGKGVYLMKVLAGGELSTDPESAIRFALELPGVSSIAIGMQSTEEISFNLQLLKGLTPPEDLRRKVLGHQRRVHIEAECQGCGTCAARCPFGAIEMVAGRPKIDYEACMTCGYCTGVCKYLGLRFW